MGIFAKIFGIKKSSNIPQELLKEATSLKKSGDIDGAILKLKSAYKSIEKTNITWSVKTFIRLPQYLQLVGRNDEAWKEFNNLLLGYPNQLNASEVLPMDHSIIYDKMRLFLQKEKRYKKAVLFGIFSYLCCTRGLYLQKRKKLLKEHISHECITSILEGLLKKAKMTDKMEEYKSVVTEEISHLPNNDIRRVEAKIKSANRRIERTR